MISFIHGKTLGVKDTDSSVKWRQSQPHPRRVCGIRRGQGALGQPFLRAPASAASAAREQAQVCSPSPTDTQPLLAGPSPSPDLPVPTCHTETSTCAQPPPADSSPEGSKVGRVQREKLGARGSPAPSSLPPASQLRPPSPPPDLAAVYSYTATRNSQRTSGQTHTRCS